MDTREHVDYWLKIAGKPNSKLRFYQTCTREFTDEQFSMIKEMYQWLLSQMKL